LFPIFKNKEKNAPLVKRKEAYFPYLIILDAQTKMKKAFYCLLSIENALNPRPSLFFREKVQKVQVPFFLGVAIIFSVLC